SQTVVRSAKRGKRRRLAAADSTSARFRLLLMAENVEQREREAIVEPGVEQHAFSCARDGREDAVRRAFLEAFRICRRTDRQRQEILIARAVVVLDFDQRQEDRLRAPAQDAPIDEPCAARLARLAPEPPLTLEERQQTLALDERSDVAFEERFPG